MTQLRIGHLYPNQMNIYGDIGNVRAVTRRAQWRGIHVDVFGVGPGAADLSTYDMLFIGGGQDRDQSNIFEDFVNHKRVSMQRAIDEEVAILAVCGGYQLLGHEYVDAEGRRLEGLGLLDLTSEAGTHRWIGNVVVESNVDLHLEPRTLVGFENHGGRTWLGAGLHPLGRVLVGGGNNGEDGGEGLLHGTVVGTYLHGPLLPKNPALADWLLACAIAHADHQPVQPLAALPSAVELAAHRGAVGLAQGERGRKPIPAHRGASLGRR